MMAGLLFWGAACLRGWLLPGKTVVWIYIVGVGVVFPLGILIASVLKIDIFGEGKPVGGAIRGFGWHANLICPDCHYAVFYGSPLDSLCLRRVE